MSVIDREVPIGPGVVVLSGPPCSGKSAVGRLLGARWAATARHHVEVDAVFDLLLPGSDRRDADRMLAYDAAHALARALVHRGRTPLLECTYSRRRQRAGLVEVLADRPLWVAEFSVSPDEAVERFLASPPHRATDLDETRVRERARGYPYSDGALRLVSTAAVPPAELADRIDAWLRDGPTPVDPARWVGAGSA